MHLNELFTSQKCPNTLKSSVHGEDNFSIKNCSQKGIIIKPVKWTDNIPDITQNGVTFCKLSIRLIEEQKRVLLSMKASMIKNSVGERGREKKREREDFNPLHKVLFLMLIITRF